MTIPVQEKRPAAAITFEIDFAALLPTSVILSAAPTVVAENKGLVTGSANVTVGTPSLDGDSTGVLFRVTGGTDGEVYVLTATGTASNGDTVEAEGVLLVREVV